MNDSHRIETLPILILEPHSRCNCRCVMCDIWKLQAGEEITFADLQAHADDITALGVRRVVFSGGEPLMHSDLFRLGDFLRERGIRTTMLTTGLLLALNAESVLRSMDDVIVSLDGPPEAHDRIRRVRGAFDSLSGGIRALHAKRAGFPIAARTTVQRANHGVLRETVHCAMDLGLRSISFLAADLTSRAFNRPAGWPAARQAQVALTQDEVDSLEAEIEGMIAALPEYRGFVLETPEKLRRIVVHFRAHLGLVSPISPPCNAPWVSAVVESDGTVRPCFFHPGIGNTKRQSLRAALNSPEGLAFRRSLDVATNPVCRRCVCSLHLAEVRDGEVPCEGRG